MASFLFSRKGFEMATSTLVVMILGILIIFGGIFLLKQLTSSGEQTVNALTTSHRDALRKMLTDGQLVATFPSNQVVQAGKSVNFGVAVMNKLSTQKDFTVRYKIIDSSNTDITAQPTIRITSLPRISLQRNEQQDLVVSVQPSNTAPPGIYTVLVNVTSVENSKDVTYDSVRFFTVNVE